MSKFTADIFGLTQDELDSFLDINAVTILSPPGSLTPPPDASYAILVFSLIILLVALIAFVVSALFWYQSAKENEGRKEKEPHDDLTPKKGDGTPGTSFSFGSFTSYDESSNISIFFNSVKLHVKMNIHIVNLLEKLIIMIHFC